MAYCSFDGYTIPKVRAKVVATEIVGDGGRTALGTYRRDTVAVKRTWELTTSPAPTTDVDTLTNYLDGILYRAGDFYLSDFGSTTATVAAYIDAFDRSEDVELQDHERLNITVIEQ